MGALKPFWVKDYLEKHAKIMVSFSFYLYFSEERGHKHLKLLIFFIVIYCESLKPFHGTTENADSMAASAEILHCTEPKKS